MNPQETLMQLGGQGLGGALVYTGTSKIYNLPTKNAMWFKVNGKRGHQTYIEVKLNGNDTYELSLISKRGNRPNITHRNRIDIYCDELQHVFESMYDNHMEKVNHGFIPV